MVLGIFKDWFPNLYNYRELFYEQIGNTLLMFIESGIISLLIGLFFGVLLVIFKPNGIKQNKVIYSILSVVINLLRSIPFIILIMFLIPFTRVVVGTAVGVKGAIIPLVFGTVPFYSRQVETTLENVDSGKIEAARSMGSGVFGLIFRVYLKEALPELIKVTTITAISLIGLTAMAGMVGAGGLGDFAKVFGQDQNHMDVVYGCLIVLVIIICVLQAIGTFLAKKTTNRALFIKKK